MSDIWLRRIVALVIALLIIDQIGTWVYAAFGAAAGLLAALLVAVVSFFSARMAAVGGGQTAWFLVPALLFTVVPLAAKIWNFLTTERTLLERSLDLAPFVLGFAVPVLLLLLVYVQMRKRTLPAAPAAAQGSAPAWDDQGDAAS